MLPESFQGQVSPVFSKPRRGYPGLHSHPEDAITTASRLSQASLVAQMLKNLPAMLETYVQSLCWEDPLEEAMTIHSSILTWRIRWTEESGGATVRAVIKSDTPEQLTLSVSLRRHEFNP